MALNNYQNVNKCLINTGNILSLIDITRKSSQNPSEELLEAINITLKESGMISASHHDNADNVVVISRPQDDLAMKMAEENLSALKIGLKLFLNADSKNATSEPIEQAFATLNVTGVDNVILAFKQQKLGDSASDIDDIKVIWRVLEDYVKNKKMINLIGLADVDEALFRLIYEWADVKPKIIQINLATCCVVPATLQAFCKDNEVQLLTHSDPIDILPKNTVDDLVVGKPLELQWVVRFLVHIRCRGVLATKGYLVSLNIKN